TCYQANRRLILSPGKSEHLRQAGSALGPGQSALRPVKLLVAKWSRLGTASSRPVPLLFGRPTGRRANPALTEWGPARLILERLHAPARPVSAGCGQDRPGAPGATARSPAPGDTGLLKPSSAAAPGTGPPECHRSWPTTNRRAPAAPGRRR